VTQVAIVEHAVVGFIDGFSTISITGLQRWEVDLLAVRPDVQHRGIAKQLIQANSTAGHELGVDMSRSLIQVDNAGSMKAFSDCGYRAENDVSGLYVLNHYTPASSANLLPNDMNLIYVNTINYRGLWVEGELSAEGLDVANRERNQCSLDIIGVVISLRQTRSIRVADSAGYNFIGQYRYWTFKLSG
jgi:GNAT superfamily N-acetyltransferase